MLLEALQIKSDDICLSIASAGDNTLSLLISQPKKVYALDINKTQLYCLELKMACFKALSYEEMLAFLGIGTCNRVAVFEKLIPYLSEEANNFFRKNLKIIKKGIIHVGKFERFFHLFRNVVIPVVSSKKKLARLSELSDYQEQTDYYNRYIHTKRFQFLFRIVFGHKFLGTMGRDRDFYQYVEEKEESGNDLKKRFEFGISHTKNRTNPYLCYIANQTYRENALPLYLKREHFNTIKKNLFKIEMIHGDLSSVNHLHFDCFNLSDIFEYMSEEEFSDCEELLSKISNPNARLCYWNMQNKRYFKDSCFQLEEEPSHQLFQKNQAYFYRDFRLYRKESHE